MNKSIGGFVVCLLGLVACDVEHYDDCDGDSFDYGDDVGGSFGHAGSTSKAGHSSSDGGSASSDGGTTSGRAGAGNGASAGNTSGNGGTDANSAGATNTGDAGAPPAVVVPPKACVKERDCEPGYNCSADTHQCLPAAEETCAELDTELACTHRSDCTPIYGGTNCSCGKDCECHGGEPGCVCESFRFFVCQAAE